MKEYIVRMFNINLVPDGGFTPTDGTVITKFIDLDEAKEFAAYNKNKFNFVRIYEIKNECEILLEFYQNGIHLNSKGNTVR